MRPDLRFHPAALYAALRGRWRALLDRGAVERELGEDIRFHIEMETEKNLAAGMSAAEARRTALLSFGGVDRVTEAHRDARGMRWIEDALADLRYAATSLARSPGFVAVSLLTLAIPIAIGTALFTAVNGFFYRPLPLPGGGGLAAVFTSDYSGPLRGASSYPDIADFAREAAPLAEIVGETRVSFGVRLHDDIVMAQGAVVTPGYFRMLQVEPALGSFPVEARPGAPAIVLSHTLWRRHLGSDSALIGRQVQVNGHFFTVVAVAEPGFRGTSREFADDFWIDGAFAPLVMPRDNAISGRSARRFRALARLRDGASLASLNARLEVVARRLVQSEPDAWRDGTGAGRKATAMLERHAHLANIPRRDLLLVIGGVAALGLGLLALACANLASMQVARGAARRREIATRLALGAGRGRLIRQLLAECALVIAPGGIAGVAAALVVMGLVSHYRPIPLPSIDLSLDWRALGFIAGALSVALLVFGLLPALQTVRADLLTDLKGGSQPSAGGIRVGGLRGGLIVAQAACSVVFTAASVMVALALIRNASLGRDDARQVLVARVNYLPAAGDSASVRVAMNQLIADLAAMPGVDHASAADFIPVRGQRRTVGATMADARGETRRLVLDANAVDPGYFGVVGIPVLRGRDFEPRDASTAGRVVIVSSAMANALWPSGDALGKRLTVVARRDSSIAEVVGIVADPVGQGPATAESFPGLLYLPMSPMAEAELVLHVRATAAPGAVAERIAQRLRGESDKLVSQEIISLDEYYDRMVLPQRLLAQASGVLAALQLLLAVAGLSGLVAYVTALRRREVGIRAALGATRRNVLALVMRQGVRLTVLGGLTGVVLSLGISRLVALSLPVSAPIVFSSLLAAAAVFVATGALAMWVPARRALDVPPADALRVD